MSVSAAALSPDEYEERKKVLDEIKLLVKGEQEEIYKILKSGRAEYSENSNGVFFDICKLPAEVFASLKKFLEFCQKNRDDFAVREEEERRAQEALHMGSTYAAAAAGRD
jgi:hypothetical protein